MLINYNIHLFLPISFIITIMTTLLSTAIFVYTSSFVLEELSYKQLKREVNNERSTRITCPIFNEKHGIEALFYVEERFYLKSAQLGWNMGRELFHGFEQVLSDTALAQWKARVSKLNEIDKTSSRFADILQESHLDYVQFNARETQLEYYHSLKFLKTGSPGTHAIRMLTLARYGNKLPGKEPPLTDEQIKQCIFQSFPVAWQQRFLCDKIRMHQGGDSVKHTSLPEIIAFMSNEQKYANAVKKEHNEVFEKKLAHLVDLGVLKCYEAMNVKEDLQESKDTEEPKCNK